MADETDGAPHNPDQPRQFGPDLAECLRPLIAEALGIKATFEQNHEFQAGWNGLPGLTTGDQELLLDLMGKEAFDQAKDQIKRSIINAEIPVIHWAYVDQIVAEILAEAAWIEGEQEAIGRLPNSRKVWQETRNARLALEQAKNAIQCASSDAGLYRLASALDDLDKAIVNARQAEVWAHATVILDPEQPPQARYNGPRPKEIRAHLRRELAFRVLRVLNEHGIPVSATVTKDKDDAEHKDSVAIRLLERICLSIGIGGKARTLSSLISEIQRV